MPKRGGGGLNMGSAAVWQANTDGVITVRQTAPSHGIESSSEEIGVYTSFEHSVVPDGHPYMEINVLVS